MRFPSVLVPLRAASGVAVCVGAALVCGVALGCARPPVGPPGGDGPAAGRVGPVALEIFTQDRPAIAGKWFEYDPDGHTLTPKAQAWIVRAGAAGGADEDARHVALRIIDIYESDRAESGQFTLGLAVFDDASGTWGAEAEWVTPRNVKATGQMCVDLFTQSELPCDVGGAWQLRLAVFQYLSPLAGIAVAEPGVFVNDTEARVARVDDVADLAALAAAVPDPAALDELADAPSASWDGTDWPFEALAPDLPLAGMAIGPRFVDDGFVGRDDVYWLIGARFDLVRFTVRPLVDGDLAAGLRFSYATVEVDREDWSAPDVMPAPTDVDVDVPLSGGPSGGGDLTGGAWLTFDPSSASAPGSLDVAAEHLADTAWPHAPPKTTRFDLAIARDDDGVRLLVSQGAALVNATQLGLDENVPPVSTP